MKTRLWFLILGILVVLGVGVLALNRKTSAYLSDLFIPKNQYEGKSISHWTNELNSPDEENSLAAIKALGAIGPEAHDAVQPLAKIMLEHPDPIHRIEAALSLRKMQPTSKIVVKQLGKALEDKERWVRMNSAMTLALLGIESKPVVPEMIKGLKDPTNQTNLNTFGFTIQERLAQALARATAGTDDAVPVLMEAWQTFREQSSKIKIGASETRRGGGPQSMQPQRAMKANAKADEEATRVNTVIQTNVSFARAMGEIGPNAKPAVPLLKELLKSELVDFQVAAKEALEKIEVTQEKTK